MTTFALSKHSLKGLQLRGLRAGCWCALVVLPLLLVRDSFTLPLSGAGPSLAELLVLRGSIIAVAAAMLAATRGRNALSLNPWPAAMVLVLALVVMVDWTIYRLGGVRSPVFAGLLTIMFGWAYFMPGGWKATAGLVTLVVASYVATLILAEGRLVVTQPTAWLQIGLLTAGGTLAAASNDLYTRALTSQFEAIGERERLAEIDALTGLSRRLPFLERVTSEVERMSRYGRPLACLLADVDDMGRLNTQLGPEAADAVLAAIAEKARAVLGPEAIGGRIGGQTFGFLLPGTAGESAKDLAETLRSQVASLALGPREAPIQATLSIGVGAVHPTSHRGPQELLQWVESALKRAKRDGKNRIGFVTEEDAGTKGAAWVSPLTVVPVAPRLVVDLGPALLEADRDRYRGALALGCGILTVIAAVEVGFLMGGGPSTPLHLVLIAIGAAGSLLWIGQSMVLQTRDASLLQAVHTVAPVMVALVVAALGHAGGQNREPYFVAIMLVMMGTSFLLPGGAGSGIVTMGLLACTWPLAELGLGSFADDLQRSVLVSGILVVGGSVGAIAHSHLNRARREDMTLRSELEQLATLDGETGARTRAAFEQRLQEENVRAHRLGQPLSLAVFEVDGMPDIEALHGSPVAAQVLRLAVDLVHSFARSVDLVARLSQSQIALILPATPLSGALALCERLRRGLGESRVSLADGQTVGFTACFGTATTVPDEDPSDELYIHAEAALMAAKQAGPDHSGAWTVEGMIIQGDRLDLAAG
jgi:diguanylate cyclase (GGDEF)-like protein